MFQCKHTKKSFEVSCVSSGMEKKQKFSVFAPKTIHLKKKNLVQGILQFTQRLCYQYWYPSTISSSFPIGFFLLVYIPFGIYTWSPSIFDYLSVSQKTLIIGSKYELRSMTQLFQSFFLPITDIATYRLNLRRGQFI